MFSSPPPPTRSSRVDVGGECHQRGRGRGGLDEPGGTLRKVGCTTRVEWPLTSVQRVCVATGGEMEDEGKIFIVQTRPCHPCGESFLYFFSPELSGLLEGLHEAVTELITASAADDVSLISDLSELSGALSSVVVMPPRLPEPPKMRKSTSVMDLAQIHELQPLCNVHTPPRLSSSQCNLVEAPPLPGRLLGHSRRRSMSETNLAKLCLDETDEELESRDDDLEDAELRQADLPKDRTSSSGSYNSYRSTDSGVRLSASPSTHCDGGRYMADNAARRFVTKSDSIDSGVRSCMKDEARAETTVTVEVDESKKVESVGGEGRQEGPARRGMGAVEEEPDVDARVGAWCLQSARQRKNFLAKNLTVANTFKDRKSRHLNRTMSESYKEVVDRHEDHRRMSELPQPRACTVYEEIVDVLKPLTAQQSREHDYEELDKCRRDIKRSYSFQEKSKPPPLPPRRPKSFSPDPWAEDSITKSGTLRKIFGLSFHSKSHSTDSMLDVDTSGYDDMRTLGSADVALVQAIGTLPRARKKVGPDRQTSRSASPKMSPKQKARSLFGSSPSRSPMIPRPKNLFLFKGSARDELQVSPHAKSFRLHRQLSLQAQRSPSTDGSLADISTPETPQQQREREQQQQGHRPYWRGEGVGEGGDDPSGNINKDSYAFLKSPKLMTKTFSFLKKFPKEKSGSLERQRKSGVNFAPPPESVTKFPNSYSLDSFAVDKGGGGGGGSGGASGRDGESEWDEGDVVPGCRLRSMSYLPPASPAIRIPFHAHHESTSTTPAGTPTGHSFSPMRKMSSPQPCSGSLSWQEEGGCWGECAAAIPTRDPPPPPAPHEPHYANLPQQHDPDYMSVEEVRGAFRRISCASTTTTTEGRRDSGGYLSMGEIRAFQRGEGAECPGCNATPVPPPPRPEEEHEYMSMDDIQSVLHQEFPGLYPPQPPDEQEYSGYKSGGEDKESFKSCYKSAPPSRKTSYVEPADYLTPQEIGRMMRREARRGEGGHHHHSTYDSHQHHHH
ncbi:hypothetical protein Pcinc_040934 [Petrolisthes cinctipes]|uniref:Uncharacterized protein n=1 Tax=Petrolisthes cinctipes TaxID=88211 RepID=A0AAE1BL39_PETCI|nr:hypothetical protein Pcinc_040934 [Petrolisthes cinctipes]